MDGEVWFIKNRASLFRFDNIGLTGMNYISLLGSRQEIYMYFMQEDDLQDG